MLKELWRFSSSTSGEAILGRSPASHLNDFLPWPYCLYGAIENKCTIAEILFSSILFRPLPGLLPQQP